MTKCHSGINQAQMQCGEAHVSLGIMLKVGNPGIRRLPFSWKFEIFQC